MHTRTELDAALAKAEADWRRASDELVRAQAARVEANHNWDTLVTVQHEQEVDRRKASRDRRSAGAIGGIGFPDRRDPDSDRRKSRAVFVAFSKLVDERHKAYLARDYAEAALAVAEADLARAVAERQNAAAALEELNKSPLKP